MIHFQQPVARPRSGSDSEAQRQAREQQSGGAGEILRTAESWVGAHPAVALGLALFAGAGVGWLVKRR